jgi:hypothetical protein
MDDDDVGFEVFTAPHPRRRHSSRMMIVVAGAVVITIEGSSQLQETKVRDHLHISSVS